jgi:hypothetical protein
VSILILKILSLSLLISISAYANSNYCHQIKKDKRLAVTLKECIKIQTMAGQLFYLTADNWGVQKSEFIHPIYQTMATNIKPGGVLFSFHKPNPSLNMTKSIDSFKTSQKIQPFFGGDNCQFQYTENKTTTIHRALLTSEQSLCEKRIHARTMKALGCNIFFGPQIEKPINQTLDNFSKPLIESARESISTLRNNYIIPTIKHFPYTPSGFDLHTTVVDVKITRQDIEKKLIPLFKLFFPFDGVLMTTHGYSSKFDSKTIVTFSYKWINFLKKNLDLSKTLLMTDSINMLQSYPNKMFYSGSKYKWPKTLSGAGLITIRSILAGHDIVINRQASKFQKRMFQDLILSAVTKSEYSEALRLRIEESYMKIIAFKRRHKKQLESMLLSTQDLNLLKKLIVSNKITNETCKQKKISKILF